MVEIMQHYWKGLLVDIPLDPSQELEEASLPNLHELKHKILVKVKRASTKPVDSPGAPTTVQAPATGGRASSSSSEELPLAPNQPPPPKPKIIEALAKLGVYAGGYSFKGLDQPGV